MSSLAGETTVRLALPELEATTLDGALSEMADALARAGAAQDPFALKDRLMERERLGCTGLGGGVAIPHCKWKGIDDVVLAIGRSRAGIDFGSPDKVPVTLILLLLSPVDAPGLHLQALARISRRLKMPGVGEGLRRAKTPEEICDVWRDGHMSLLEANG